ncbi:hypothetical protein HK100_000306 [Physocladia obscura]|uniref:RanBP2-type domain-containing protein n=1 Tax=Physocladia obscura TaxID=109957 RepID=A0AAD5XH20_9FUNG|nr:hypothetical protein HK100_000306 [Physocladia obscura]
MSSEWECGACTFLNPKKYGLVCEVCGTERTRSISAVPAASTSQTVEGEKSETGALSKTTNSVQLTAPEQISRAQMERERLARRAAQLDYSQGSKKRVLPFSDNNDNNQRTTLSRPASAHRICLTAIKPFPCSNTTVSFDQIVQKRQIRAAFFSSFQSDFEWIANHLPPHIKICFALHNPKRTPPRRQNNITLVYPKLTAGYSIMHVKLCVLYYDAYVRVVISSANLVDYDWESLENVVWFQDFPKTVGSSGSSGVAIAGSEKTVGDVFREDLIKLLKDMEVDEWVYEDLSAFDFSPCRAHLVISKPSTQTGENLSKYGIGRLSAIALLLSKKTPIPESVDMKYQTSSLGSLAPDWLSSFESAARGTLLESKDNTTTSAEEVSPPPPPPTIKIVYPTAKTVATSIRGASGAGTITWFRKTWVECQVKHLLRDSVSTRAGALSHCKIFVCGDTYYYCGSHNFTMSAWGRVEAIGRKKKGMPEREKRVVMTNWEVGVVVEGGDGGIVPFETGEKFVEHGDGIMAAHVI